MITIEYVRERLAELQEERLRHKAGSGSAAKGGSKGTRTRKAAKRGGGGRAATGRPGAALSQKAAKKTAAKAAKKAAAKKTVKLTAIKATKKAAKKATTKSATRTVAAKKAPAVATKKTAKKGAKRPLPLPRNASASVAQAPRRGRFALPAKKRSAKATKKRVPTENQIRLALAGTSRYSTLENAIRANDRNRTMVPILRGRDGRYWVPANNRSAANLVRGGQAVRLPNEDWLIGRR